MENTRTLDVVFIREFKFFIKKYNKKQKEDYLLNVNKIIKDKFNTKFLVPNTVQSFLLNYEIKKLLDKAINIKNQKYNRIVFLNSTITFGGIQNTIEFLDKEYLNVKFNYIMIDPKKDFDESLFDKSKLTFLSY